MGKGNDKLLKICFGSDFDFYEDHLADAPLEEQAAFMKEFPDFLNERDAVEGIDADEIFRKIMERAEKE